MNDNDVDVENDNIEIIKALEEDHEEVNDEYDDVAFVKEEPQYILQFRNKNPLFLYPLRTGSYWSSLFFILFSTLGSGVIILPITMKDLGIFPATFLLLACAVISYYTVIILVLEGFNHNKYSFGDLVKVKFGSTFLIIMDICFHTGNLLGIIVFNKISKSLKFNKYLLIYYYSI